jgi:integrase
MKRTNYTHNRPSQHKGRRITADYIDYDEAMIKGKALLWNSKPVVGFYIIFSINTGLRASDTLKLRHSDLNRLVPGDYLYINEGKTGKRRDIQINAKILEHYRTLREVLQKQDKYDPTDFIFKSQKSQKDMGYTITALNQILKKVFEGHAPNISTHSLRKSFGRHVYEQSGRNEDALVKLSEIFQHSSVSITRTYLGLRREELGSIYMNL